MIAINYYSETKRELEIAKIRLQVLLDRKEELFQSILGLHSPSFDSDTHTTANNDKVISYLEAVEGKKDENGLSLQDKIEQAEDNVKRLQGALKRMAAILSKSTSIEVSIYYHVVVEGKTRTEAVELVAEEYFMSINNVWKNYYPKIKNEIEKMDSESQVNHQL